MVRIALGQINTTVGDLKGNVGKMAEWAERATAAGADLVCFPELAVTGYPPEDLVLRPEFVRDNVEALESLARRSGSGCAVLTGFVERSDAGLHNSAALIHGGEVVATYRKVKLPNYGVFDEQRYFAVGHRCPIFELSGIKVGISICEDCWYPSGPMAWQAHHGAELLININGSPYHAGKRGPREEMVAGRAADYGAYVAYVNLIGGQDELVFDGDSVIFGPHGELLAHAASFREDLLMYDVDLTTTAYHRPHEKIHYEAEGAARLELETMEVPLSAHTERPKPALTPRIETPLEGAAEIYAAVVLGTGDYIHKQRFQKVVVGMSGGVDSALTAAIAADALGPENVIGVRMSSRHTSAESLEDAGLVAEALGMQLMDFSIEPPHRGFEEILAPVFQGTKPGVAEENLQPRIRSTILHALSNKFGYIVLSTGNKSELAIGYGTLYLSLIHI